MTEEEREENYESLIDFLDKDIEIKDKLINVAPSEMDGYDENTKIKYLDKLYDTMKEMKFSFKSIAKRFKSASLEGSFNQYFENAEKEFAEMEYNSNYSSVSKMYQRFFSDMNPELIDAEKNNIYGYGIGSTFDRVPNVMDKVKSVNDLLHLTYFAVLNNEQLYQSMPIISQRKLQDSKDPEYSSNITTLYGEGEPNAEAKGIYEKMLQDTKVGATDIISMKDRTLMMIRDRGHAMVVDIDSKDKQNIFVSYHIPKMCNLEMTMRLPGVDFGSITTLGARGSLALKDKNVADKVFNLIEKVPMDDDMEIDSPYFPYTQEYINRRVKEYRESIQNEKQEFTTEKIKSQNPFDVKGTNTQPIFDTKGVNTQPVLNVKELKSQPVFTANDAKNLTENRRFGGITNIKGKIKNFLKSKDKTKDRED